MTGPEGVATVVGGSAGLVVAGSGCDPDVLGDCAPLSEPHEAANTATAANAKTLEALLTRLVKTRSPGTTDSLWALAGTPAANKYASTPALPAGTVPALT